MEGEVGLEPGVGDGWARCLAEGCAVGVEDFDGVVVVEDVEGSAG